jgi:hypothetical protein
MVHRRTLRGLIWASLGLQLGGLVYDIFWHALHSGFEATTRAEMLEHLGTVHVPIYLGVLCVVLTTAMALFRQVSLGDHGAALPIAFVGALISAAGETWHAYKHLQLATHGGPLAAAVSFFGFLLVVSALWLSRSADRGHLAGDIDERRAA